MSGRGEKSGPQIDPPDLPELEQQAVGDGPHEELEIAGARIAREGQGPIATARLTVDECELRGVAFEPGQIRGFNMSDAILHECDLSNVQARRGDITRMEADRCRFVGFALTDGTMRDARVEESTMMLASFGHSRLRDVVFEHVNLREASFLQATLEGVVFDRCDLAGADFRGAKLINCAIRGSSLDDVVGVSSLTGLSMPWPDLVESVGALAHALGIEVESSGD